MLSTGSKMQGFWLQFSENGLDTAPVLKTADTRSLKMYVRVHFGAAQLPYTLVIGKNQRHPRRF